MDPVLRSLLDDRLRASELADEAAELVRAACGPAAPPRAGGPPVWLREITVEGFRGIGPPARLALDPRPGLTVVTGRNGSGKSSFAEGLELLLSGALKRWEKRPRAWTETWQCLHHAGPTRLTAAFVVEGGDDVTITREWPHGAAHDTARAAHGWQADLAAFRPFLAYAELATMFDTLTSLYDALTPVLGLADVDAVSATLAQERLALDNRRKDVKRAEEALLAPLDALDDARAAAVAAAIRSRRRDLDALAALLEAPPPHDDPELRRLAALAPPSDAEIAAAFAALRAAEAAHAAAASTDAARATSLARLLREALAARDGADCPVCGTPGVLDDAWAARASTQAAELDAQAGTLRAAAAALDVARRAAAALGEDEPSALAAATAQRERAARARTQLAAQDSQWRELAAAAGQWLAAARAVEASAGRLKALKDAEKWVKDTAGDLRAERFAPIAERAIANWRELRQGSSVDLHEITLRKVGRGGRADFDVRADGEGANALGVMSQGELLALSVSVFLPRAALDESPFRFAVIDDPVQAMDPAKVDGLARVLHRAAATRQIVVFTHDDRLPEAIRRLRLDATMLHVDRRARSTVAVRESRSPARRYLDDAKRLARSAEIPADVRARIVPTLCRDAVEAAAAAVVRRRAVRDGASLEAVDADLRDARALRETLALALFGDLGRGGDVGPELKRRLGQPAAALVTELNAGAHGRLDATTLAALPARTQDLIAGLG